MRWGPCAFHSYGLRQGPVLSLCEHDMVHVKEFCACKTSNKDTMFRISKVHLAFAANTTTKKEKEDLMCDVIENILLLFI